MKITKTLVVAAAVFTAASANAEGARIAISPDAKTIPMPRTMYGIFFEDINFAGDGGIYPELLANRGFDWKTTELEGWERDYRGDAMARITVQENAPLNPNTARHLRMECFGPGKGCGVRNRGFHGVSVKAGEKYDLTFYARGLDGYAGGLRFVLEDGGEVVCEAKLANDKMSISPKAVALDPKAPKWRRHSFTFAPRRTVINGTFSILMDAPGIVELEQVSLYPQDTFNGRRNGLRRDLVQLLKDMKPGVLRFPGGCVLEGDSFEHWYDWKRTVGPVERRENVWSVWGYWQTFGLGYFEYFCLAEDIGAEPLPICLSGMTCQFRGPKFAPLDSMGYFADSICDLIDFANADPSNNKWGALRAQMGHPAPFNLKMVGVGNENWGQDFLDRYLAIAKIVRERHPEIKLVSTAGASPIGGDHELAWKTLTCKTADMVDEHFYANPGWMMGLTHQFDGYDRSKPKVYAGEYACHVEDKANSLYSALCEAACMIGFERNCDIVEMSSYAPLFGKIGHEQWKPDLIWFDNLRVFTTPNYHVQKMFGNNLPSVFIPSAASGDSKDAATKGAVGFATWESTAEFKDLVVKDEAGRTLFSGTPDPAACDCGPDGEWTLCDGALRQSREWPTYGSWMNIRGVEWSGGTIRFKTRRTGGKEGFMARFFCEGENVVTLNLGGWGNTRSAIDATGFGVNGGGAAFFDFKVEDDRWYDVELYFRGGMASVKVDGKVLAKDVAIGGAPPTDFHQVCGFDRETGEYVVKCVNLAADRPLDLVVDFGERLPAGKIKVEELTGDPGVVNDMEHPERCKPVSKAAAFPGGREFKMRLPASSLTIIRAKK